MQLTIMENPNDNDMPSLANIIKTDMRLGIPTACEIIMEQLPDLLNRLLLMQYMETLIPTIIKATSVQPFLMFSDPLIHLIGEKLNVLIGERNNLLETGSDITVKEKEISALLHNSLPINAIAFTITLATRTILPTIMRSLDHTPETIASLENYFTNFSIILSIRRLQCPLYMLLLKSERIPQVSSLVLTRNIIYTSTFAAAIYYSANDNIEQRMSTIAFAALFTELPLSILIVAMVKNDNQLSTYLRFNKLHFSTTQIINLLKLSIGKCLAQLPLMFLLAKLISAVDKLGEQALTTINAPDAVLSLLSLPMQMLTAGAKLRVGKAITNRLLILQHLKTACLVNSINSAAMVIPLYCFANQIATLSVGEDHYEKKGLTLLFMLMTGQKFFEMMATSFSQFSEALLEINKPALAQILSYTIQMLTALLLLDQLGLLAVPTAFIAGQLVSALSTALILRQALPPAILPEVQTDVIKKDIHTSFKDCARQCFFAPVTRIKNCLANARPFVAMNDGDDAEEYTHSIVSLPL